VDSAKETAQNEFMQPNTVNPVEAGADVSDNVDGLHKM
jgi:hypothetical protein